MEIIRKPPAMPSLHDLALAIQSIHHDVGETGHSFAQNSATLAEEIGQMQQPIPTRRPMSWRSHAREFMEEAEASTLPDVDVVAAYRLSKLILPAFAAGEAEAYVPRKLRVTDVWGRKTTCSEEEFFQFKGPLVVLGEPGSGKSRLVKEFAAADPGASVLRARDIGTEIKTVGLPHRIVIDEICETPFLGSANLVVELLARMPRHTNANILLTCRTAEWHDCYADAIHRRWGRKPLLGLLLPLEKPDIIGFAKERHVDVHGETLGAENGLRGMGNVIGNPRILSMLLRIFPAPTPNTKTMLLEEVCKELAFGPVPGTLGSYHNAEFRDSLLDAAGLVCAQLLLTGARLATVENREPLLSCINVSHWGMVDEEASRHVLETELFRPSSQAGAYEPCKKHITEYLAARWMAKRFREGRLRLENLNRLLRIEDSGVPPASRALHAWIATLGGEEAWPLAMRDPIGLFCHGDPALLEEEQLVELIRIIREKISNGDIPDRLPWQTLCGNFKAGSRLRDQLVEWGSGGKAASCFVLSAAKSLGDSKATRAIGRKLREAALDLSASNRDTCLDVLVSEASDEDVNKIVGELLKLNDIDSIKLAFDAVWRNTDRFQGGLAARVMVDFDLHMFDWRSVSRLTERFSEQMLEDGLSELGRIAASRAHPNQRVAAKKWIVPLLERLVEKTDPSWSAWRTLLLAQRMHHYDAKWNKTSAIYLEGRHDLRRSIFSELTRQTKGGRLYEALARLEDSCPALALKGEDTAALLDEIVKRKPENWWHHWRDVVEYGRARCRIDEGDKLVAAQAKASKVLRNQLNAIERSRKHKEEAELFEQAKRAAEAKVASDEALRKEFRAARKELSRGKNVALLSRAVEAHLHMSVSDEPGGGTSRQKLAHLAGEDMIPAIRAGIGKIVRELTDTVTVRRLAEMWAGPSREFSGLVLLSHCIMCAENGESLPKLPAALNAPALAAFHLCHWADKLDGYARARNELERTVLSETTLARSYFSDIVSPFLAAGSDFPHRIRALLMSAEHSEAAGYLSRRWLDDFACIPEDSFGCMAVILRTQASQQAVRDFVRERISKGCWKSEEQRRLLMFVAFLCDLSGNRKALAGFAKQSRESLWAFHAPVTSIGRTGCSPGLAPEQAGFLVSMFGSAWPFVESRGLGREPTADSAAASDFLLGAIRSLGENPSEQARRVLLDLRASGDTGGYVPEITRALSHQQGLLRSAPGPAHDLRTVRAKLGEFGSVPNPVRPARRRFQRSIVLDVLEASRNVL